MLFKNGLEFLALIGALIGTLLDEMNMANCCAGLNNTPIAVQELILKKYIFCEKVGYYYF